MGMRNVDLRRWHRQLMLELRRDKKKAFALGVLVILAGVLGIRLAMRHGTPPRARAAAKAVVAPIRAEGASPRPARIGPGNPDWLAKLRADRGEITRDMFRPNPAYFPPDVKTQTDVKIEPGPSKAETQPARPQAPDPREQQLAIMAQARSLNLQSTVVSEGKTSTAIINNLVLRKGDWINDFQIVEITARTVVVAKKEVKVTLQMKR